jgi:hypothetical protein
MFARFSTEMKGVEELKAMMIGKVSMFRTKTHKIGTTFLSRYGP